MRRALVLSVILVSGCRQSGAPGAADAAAKTAAAKASKEMSDLLKKADAITASTRPSSAAVETVSHPVAPSPAPAANPPAAPAEPPHAAPVKSKADLMRDQAVAAYGDRLGSLRRTAEAARLKKDRFQQVCQGRSAEVKTECQVLTADMTDASKLVEREIADIQESARRAGMDPGVMHDLLAKYGF